MVRTAIRPAASGEGTNGLPVWLPLRIRAAAVAVVVEDAAKAILSYTYFEHL